MGARFGKLRHRWRLAVFLLLFVASGTAGVVLYRNSRPVSVNLLVESGRPKIDIFVSDPAAVVSLSVEVGGRSDPLTAGLDASEAAIYATVTPSKPRANVDFLVFVQGRASAAHAITVPNYFPGSLKPKGIMAFPGNELNLSAGENKLGHYLTTVRVPGVVRASDGELQAQMPILNYLYLPHQVGFTAHGCVSATGGSVQPFAPNEINWTPHRVLAPSCGPSAVFRSVQKTFYSPTRLVSREQLDANTSGYQILNNIPTGGGTVVAQTADWQGGADLAPSITAVRSGVQDARSQNAFFSGVALAIAGAALIAALQERKEPEEELNEKAAEQTEEERRKQRSPSPSPRPPEPTSAAKMTRPHRVRRAVARRRHRRRRKG